jgi:hypothetical protein
MMTSAQIFRILGCLAVCGMLASATAMAADKPADDDDRLDEAWKDAVGAQEPILTDKQFAALNNLAYQAAVTNVCDGYTLDNKKFAKEFAAATTVPNPDMSRKDAGAWETAVLIRFGTSYGLLLAEGNAHTDSFCANAKDLKGDKDVPNVWK